MLIVIIATVALFYWLWCHGWHGSKVKPWGGLDGDVYLKRLPEYAVYSRRWLPRLLWNGSQLAANITSWTSLVITAYVITLWSHSIWAGLFFIALPIFRINVGLPTYTDSIAICLSTTSAYAYTTGHPVVAIILVCLAGACKESAPVFAAIFAAAPILLLGLLFVNWLPAEAGVAKWQTLGLKAFRGRDPLHWRYLTPWGLILPAAIVYGDWRVAVAVALGYAQMLIATDDMRLVQWGAPIVVVAASQAPTWALPIMLLASVFSSYRHT